MSDTVKGSVIGALITGAVSVAIFFLGNFSTQDTIEKNIVKTLSGYFDSVEKDMTYEQALQAVYKENESLKNEIADLKVLANDFEKKLSEKQSEIDQQASAEEISKVIQDATEYWNHSDFVQALVLLKNAKTKSQDIETLYEEYSGKYVVDLLAQAEILISERKYSEAVDILKTGSAVAADVKLLNAKIDEINNKPTALLSNLVPVSGTLDSDYYGIWDISDQDNYGNKYSSGICLKQEYTRKAHIVYALDNKYTVMTGKFVLSEAGKNTDGNYVLYIYTLVDGETNLLYESPVLSTATRPIDVEVNVAGVMDLVIEVYDPNKGSDNAWTAFVEAKLE